MLLAHRIALWDVIQSCDIKGSSDSSIKNVQPTDIGMILEKTNVTQIYANGNKAGQLYKRYQFFGHGDRSDGASIHKSGKCRVVAGTAV